MIPSPRMRYNFVIFLWSHCCASAASPAPSITFGKGCLTRRSRPNPGCAVLADGESSQGLEIRPPNIGILATRARLSYRRPRVVTYTHRMGSDGARCLATCCQKRQRLAGASRLRVVEGTVRHTRVLDHGGEEICSRSKVGIAWR